MTEEEQKAKEAAEAAAAAEEALKKKDDAPKTFTEEELKQAIDAAVKEAATAAETKVREEESRKAAEKEEADKLAAMDEKEREKAILEKREKELAEKEAAIAKREAKTLAAGLLTENGLPTDIADLVIGGTSEVTKSNVALMKTSFDKAVEAAVVERLKGKSPDTGNTNITLTKKFSELSSTERAELKEKNPEQYQKLRAQHINQ